jgi:hypothetical protein
MLMRAMLRFNPHVWLGSSWRVKSTKHEVDKVPTSDNRSWTGNSEMGIRLSIYLDYYIDILLMEKPSAPWMDAIVKTLGIAGNAT